MLSYSLVVLFSYCLILVLSYSLIVLFSCCLILLLYYSRVFLFSCSFILLLFYCFILLFSYCFILLFFYSLIFLQIFLDVCEHHPTLADILLYGTYDTTSTEPTSSSIDVNKIQSFSVLPPFLTLVTSMVEISLLRPLLAIKVCRVLLLYCSLIVLFTYWLLKYVLFSYCLVVSLAIKVCLVLLLYCSLVGY